MAILSGCLRNALLLSVSILALAEPAAAEDAPAATATVTQADSNTGGLAEIVVTAQKREQGVDSVGMSISAVTGDVLIQRGVQSVDDLAKVVPGFVYAPSVTLSPVYTIRGIGFYDDSLASSPAVSIYLDEAPVPFPIMSKGVSFDLQRVEVLKGPQGTLFGEDSTGGAVNYIAAKPTSQFETGGDLSYERFGLMRFDGYVSGPVASNLNARLAIGTDQGGAWQKSVSRDDVLGNRNFNTVRILLDWTPTDRLTIHFNANGFIDQSDTQAGQLIAVRPSSPAGAPANVLAQNIAPENDTAADWNPAFPHRNDNSEGQVAVRADYRLTDTITATSLTSYAAMKVNSYFSVDGSPIQDTDYRVHGHIGALNEELRVAQDTSVLNWVLGANYSHYSTSDTQNYYLADSSAAQSTTPNYMNAAGSSVQKIRNYAVFGDAQYKITSNLSLEGGLRYTESDRHGGECSFTTSPINGLGLLVNEIQELVGKPNPILVQPGQCLTLNSSFTPTVSPYPVSLNENNVSWKAGLNYKFDEGLLLYANVSRGYKAGTIPTIAGLSLPQYTPVKQESVLAYEAGFKAPLFDRHVQLNAAGFYYDYSDKQVRGNILDPALGLEELVQNVPKSSIWGLESDVQMAPFQGLVLSVGATYLNSRVNSAYNTYNSELQFSNFKGAQLPFTPHFQANFDAQYEWQLSSGLKPFVGLGLTGQTKTQNTFVTAAAPAPDYRIKGYALLDLRAGIAAADDSWRLTLFGQNVTNTYYWYGLDHSTDNLVRETGRPATYGVRLSVRIR
jgi:iron complex outermembrane recepter protein